MSKIECMKRETSGTDTNCNLHNCDDCSLCYEQGTIGEQKEVLMFAVDTMRKYLMMQANYEARLKADMMAMLTEIQLEIADNVESIIGHYDASTPERKRPLCKSARNEGKGQLL